MIDLLFKGAGGMSVQQTKMEVTAHNVANVNTNSFKGSRTTFADLLYQKASTASGVVVPEEESRDGVRYLDIPDLGRGVRVKSVDKDFTQGVLENTGRSLDLAIEGDGFFRVVSADGENYYTRAGSFYINENGYITTSDGARLSPRVDVPSGFKDISISSTGLITITDADGETKELGQIELYSLQNPNSLLSKGDNLYLEAAEGERVRRGHPGENGLGRIRPGFLEKSNVDLAWEINSLIESQRAYQVNSRVVRTAEEMWSIANNLYR